MNAINVQNIASPDNVDQELSAQQVLSRVLPDCAALPPEKLLQVNLDIQAAATTVLGALPEIMARREAIAALVPTQDLSFFDKLEDYAIACRVAHLQHLTATQSESELSELVAEAQEARERLLADMTALAKRGLVSGSNLKHLSGTTGYKNLAQDLGLLVATLSGAWPAIEGKSAITAQELERAGKLELRLTRVVGLKEQGPSAAPKAADLRVRAFTLLLRSYDQVRRFVTCLRWDEDDVEAIAPTLYTGRGRRKGSEVPTEPSVPGPTTGQPATTTPGTPAAATTPQAKPPTAASRDPFMPTE